MVRKITQTMKYNKNTCPKSETWFINGGKCGWAWVCDNCKDNPKLISKVKKVKDTNETNHK